MEAVAISSKDILHSSRDDIEDIEIDKNKEDAGGIWKCSYCNLEEHYDYKGSKPPFAKHLSFLEDCYIMKDPFSPLNRGEILLLGAHCSICEKTVCMECSLFYTKRFCKLCAFKNIENFPKKLKIKTMQLNCKEDFEAI